jgi:8-oxo-dGTP pyrophosphatase MutT (NUDIX family)
MPFEKSVGGIIFRRNKKKIEYLALLKTPRRPNAPDYWGFPQGHIEKGETWQETLKREVREETGLKSVKIIPDFYAWVKYFYRAIGKEAERRKRNKVGLNVFKITTFYLAETRIKKIKLSREHIDYKWLPYEKAREILTYKQAKKALEKGNYYLNQNSKIKMQN